MKKKVNILHLFAYLARVNVDAKLDAQLKMKQTVLDVTMWYLFFLVCLFVHFQMSRKSVIQKT